MSNTSINEILAKLEEAVRSPRNAIKQYEEKTGNKAVGCVPPYCPEELVHAAGLLPVGLWGGQAELSRVRAALPPFACSIMQSVKEYELNGTYDLLAAVLVPSLCDTLKAMGQKWTRESVPCIQFVHPHNRNIPAARTYLRAEYQSVRERLEKVIGRPIPDEAIEASIETYNAHRHTMRAFSEAAALHPELMGPAKRHTVYKSAFFMRKEEHAALVTKLTAALLAAPTAPWKGLKVVVTGILLEPASLLEVFEGLGVAVIDDDLAQESRQYRVDTPAGTGPLDRMAQAWQNMYGCSLAYDAEKFRVPMLCEMKNRRGADAVIVGMMKFCDPEEFDYPIIKRVMELKKIPLLQLEVDQQAQSPEQVRTRLQSFVEMLEASRKGKVKEYA